ncbi:hypothetical protein JXB31_05505 [Candidatus Woesearchaeota archaeon]|nr:hypothetical protein [Candidatus Woesearchaeota archaeon]
MLSNKKAFVGLWSDVLKGFLAGLIVGIILVMLVFFEIIPIYDLCKFCGA